MLFWCSVTDDLPVTRLFVHSMEVVAVGHSSHSFVVVIAVEADGICSLCLLFPDFWWWHLPWFQHFIPLLANAHLLLMTFPCWLRPPMPFDLPDFPFTFAGWLLFVNLFGIPHYGTTDSGHSHGWRWAAGVLMFVVVVIVVVGIVVHCSTFKLLYFVWYYIVIYHTRFYRILPFVLDCCCYSSLCIFLLFCYSHGIPQITLLPSFFIYLIRTTFAISWSHCVLLLFKAEQADPSRDDYSVVCSLLFVMMTIYSTYHCACSGMRLPGDDSHSVAFIVWYWVFYLLPHLTTRRWLHSHSHLVELFILGYILLEILILFLHLFVC